MTSYTMGWRSLRAVCPNLSEHDAMTLAIDLAPAFHEFGITSQKRAAAAVAEMAEETDGFRTRTEYASGAEYEGREDLGNTHPGDGKRFKGRADIMITGRANYATCGKALGLDLVNHPDLLAHPSVAARASCWWWKTHGCNQLADRGDFVALTRVINGGTNGLESREAYWARAKKCAQFLTPRKVRS